jgi:hypothetical protein
MNSTLGQEILDYFGDKGRSFQGADIPAALHALANADAVCFDVDSTVIQEEGIVRIPHADRPGKKYRYSYLSKIH